MARQYRLVAGEWTFVIAPIDESVRVSVCDRYGVDLASVEREGDVVDVVRAFQRRVETESAETVVREVVAG